MTGFRRVYLDTAPIIYYLENSALYRDKMKRFFEECLERKVQILTSVITVEEYLVFPYASGKMELADNFRRFIDYMKIEVVAIDDKTAERAAEIRGRFKHFKAMDSLQIAAAIVNRCDMFLTNDRQLKQEAELPCMTMEDLMTNDELHAKLREGLEDTRAGRVQDADTAFQAFQGNL